jgi:hypothetical protein
VTSAERLRIALRRGSLVILFAMICGGVALAVYGSNIQPEYTAQSRLLLPDPTLGVLAAGTSAPAFDPGRQAAAAVAVGQAPAFYRSVAVAMGLPADDWGDIESHLDVGASDSDTLLVFRARASQSGEAVRLANAAATRYLTYHRTVLGAQLQAAIAGVQEGIAANPKDSGLQESLIRLRAFAATGAAEPKLADRALAAAASSRSAVRDWLVGIVAGLVVGLLIVAVREALDIRLRSGLEVEELAGVPILAHVAAWRQPATMRSGSVRTSGDVAITRAFDDSGWRSIALIGPSDRGARLGIAARVAQGLADDGRQVVVGDLGGDTKALSRLLHGHAEPSQGQPVNGVVSIMSSDEIAVRSRQRLFLNSESNDECAVISAPGPVEALGSDLVVALDGAVLVFDESTTRAEVRDSVTALDRLSLPLLGIVMAV